MKAVMMALAAVFAVGAMTATADAAKKCKAGYEYDPSSKKCVPSDGS